MYLYLSSILIICALTNCVDAGCLVAKLCCKSRNTSCFTTETKSLFRNVLLDDQRLKHVQHIDSDYSINVLPPLASTGEPTKDSRVESTAEVEAVTMPDFSTPFNGQQKHENLLLGFDLTENKTENLFLESSGYDELDYGAGNSFDPLTSFDDPRAISFNVDKNDTLPDHLWSSRIGPDPADAKYQFIELFSEDKSHKRRHVTDVKTSYKGGAKEISYVIVEEKAVGPTIVHQHDMMQSDGVPFAYNDYKGTTVKQCYCDEECLALNDCCSDYAEACPRIDCAVSPWSPWSPCTNNKKDRHETTSECGPGVSARAREILTRSENGGIPCPHVDEQKACYNADSNLKCGAKASELALLLPYVYNNARKPGYKTNMYYDISRNFNKKDDDPSRRYCAVFTITWQSADCTEDSAISGISEKFRPGKSVCVQCESTARKSSPRSSDAANHYYSYEYNKRHVTDSPPTNGGRTSKQDVVDDERCTGDGVESTETWFTLINRWVDSTNSYRNNCFGRWILQRKDDGCNCEDSFMDLERYIFV